MQSNTPAETVKDHGDTRLVRLSFYHGYVGGRDDTGIHEYFAELNPGGVTLWKTSTNMSPQTFRLDIEDAERFAHALLDYQGDQARRAQQERDNFKAEIETTHHRAQALDIQMAEEDGFFSLSCTPGHPLAHVLERYAAGNGVLSLGAVQDRLTALEEAYERAQTGDASEGVSNFTFDWEKLQERAKALGASLFRDGPHYYELSFPGAHPFFAFWMQDHLLTIGQVVYRLNYAEGVMEISRTF